MSRAGEVAKNELSEELLETDPSAKGGNFLAGYLKGGKDKVLQTISSDHIEVTCRMTLSMFLAYVVSFADVRWITPIEQAPIMGILIPFIVMLFPTLMFSFGLMLLPMFSIFLCCFISSTMLLSIAVAGGTGWFIVSFTVWSFWVCFLRWDKAQGTKVSLILIGVVFQTVLVWPTFETVQDGFIVPYPGGAPPESQAVLIGYLSGAIAAAKAMGAGKHDILVESGVLEGRTAVITVNGDGTASTFVAGGMWMVRGNWTFSGVNNPLASFQNLMVVVCWMIVIVAVIPLLPPFRTMRSAVWRGMIPGALMDAAGLLRAHVDKLEKEGSLAAAQDGSLAEARGKIGQLLGKCVYHMNALYAGNVAKFTFFEPRIFACKPVEVTGGYLMHLSMIVSRVVSASAGVALFTNRDFCYQNMDQYLSTAKNLETCAKALAIGNYAMLDGVELNSDAQHDCFTMHQRTAEIAGVSRKWLGAMTGEGDHPSLCSDESRKATMINLRPWIDVHFTHFVHLAQLLVAPFKKSSYTSLKKNETYALVRLVWCIKYALGMGFLLAIGAYWPAYKEGFAVADKDDPYRLLYAITNGGWVLVAYCFATTQTAEGSIKKGALRLAGTIAGAFSGWLASIACEDDSFSSRFNPYGLVAWLTITSGLATFASTDRGFLARVSLVSDYSFGPIYFVITQIIVVVGVVQFGPEVRTGILVNRMVANIVGILMGAFLAIIPPGNYGGDPGHTKNINDFHWKSVRSIIERVCRSEEISDEAAMELSKEMQALSASMVQTSAKMLELTSDFHTDASRLAKFPAFSVDQMLKMHIGLVTRDNHVASFIPRVVATILASDATRPLLVEKNGTVQKKMKEILQDMKWGIASAPDLEHQVEFHLAISELVDSRDDIDLLVRTLGWLISEMRNRDKALKQIRWGAFGGMQGPAK